MRWLIIIFILTLTLPVFAQDELEVLTFSRGSCQGSCPVYEVNFHSDGLVIFKGQFHVSNIGPKITRTNPDMHSKLKTAFMQTYEETINSKEIEDILKSKVPYV